MKKKAGYTLLELIIVVAIVAITATILVTLLYTTNNLSAQNTAINTSHFEAKKSLDKLFSEISSSVSVPMLTDTSLNIVASGSAAGIEYQTVIGGPFLGSATATGTISTISVNTGTNTLTNTTMLSGTLFALRAGMRIQLPTLGFEGVLTNSSVTSPTFYPVVASTETENPLGVTVTGSPNYPVYYTVHSALVVAKTPSSNPASYELRYYPVLLDPTSQPGSYTAPVMPTSGTYFVLTTGIKAVSGTSAPQPFAIVSNTANQTYYVTMNLGTQDTSSSNRGIPLSTITISGTATYNAGITQYP